MFYEDCAIGPTEEGDIYALGCVAYEVRLGISPPTPVTEVLYRLDLRWPYPVLRDIGMGYFYEAGGRGGEGPNETEDDRRRLLEVRTNGRHLENDGGVLGEETRGQALLFGSRSKALPTQDSRYASTAQIPAASALNHM